MHVFIPVEALISIRSIAIVLLIVAHELRHVHCEYRSFQSDILIIVELRNNIHCSSLCIPNCL